MSLNSKYDPRDGGLHNAFLETRTLANVYAKEGKPKMALEQYEKLLAIKTKLHGKDHPSLASSAASYNKLALLFRKQERYEEALELNKKSLAITIKFHGADTKEVADAHYLIGIVYYNMGGVYLKQGKFSDAVEMHTKSIKAQGSQHPDVADANDDISHVYDAWCDAYEKQGKHAEALELMKKALDFKIKAFGPEHAFVAVRRTVLADKYASQGTAPPTTSRQPMYVVATPVDSSIATSNSIPTVEVVTVCPLPSSSSPAPEVASLAGKKASTSKRIKPDTHIEETDDQKKKRKIKESNARSYQKKKEQDEKKMTQIETLLAEKETLLAEKVAWHANTEALLAQVDRLQARASGAELLVAQAKALFAIDASGAPADGEQTQLAPGSLLVSAASGPWRSHSGDAAYDPHGDTDSDEE